MRRNGKHGRRGEGVVAAHLELAPALVLLPYILELPPAEAGMVLARATPFALRGMVGGNGDAAPGPTQLSQTINDEFAATHGIVEWTRPPVLDRPRESSNSGGNVLLVSPPWMSGPVTRARLAVPCRRRASYVRPPLLLVSARRSYGASGAWRRSREGEQQADRRRSCGGACKDPRECTWAARPVRSTASSTNEPRALRRRTARQIDFATVGSPPSKSSSAPAARTSRAPCGSAECHSLARPSRRIDLHYI